MKIALLNGSPRAKNVSGFVLADLKSTIGDKSDFAEFNLYKNRLTEEEIKEILSCNAIVIAAPLYIDALPSHVVQALTDIEAISGSSQKNINVFAVINCGFSESVNNLTAIRIVSNWCTKCGFRWMYGLGIGSGERLLVEKNSSGNSKITLWSIIGFIAVKVFTYEPEFLEKIRKNSYRKASDKMASDILQAKSGENIYVRCFFPKTVFLSNLMTNASFFVKLKTNGNKLNDMTKKDI